MRLFKNNKGLTIVELIIALAISLIVVAAAGFILLTQSGVIRLNRSVSKEQQRLNTAYNAVRYSLRMAGFDYGQHFYSSFRQNNPPVVYNNQVPPPVQVVQASYPANPYEVIVSYDYTANIYASSACSITSVGAGTPGEFSYSGTCSNFFQGEFLNIIDPTPLGNNPIPTPPITLCITQLPAGKLIQTNPPGATGAGGACPNNNPVPPKNIGGGTVVAPMQILFYWGNSSYLFNSPFDVQGTLYECQLNSLVLEPPANAGTYTAPVCTNTITLSDYIYNFSVAPQDFNFNGNPLLSYYITSGSTPGALDVFYSNGTQQDNINPYLNLSISGESDVAVSSSPAYGVHAAYNPNNYGTGSRGSSVIKTLNSNIFLRNVSYGS